MFPRFSTLMGNCDSLKRSKIKRELLNPFQEETLQTYESQYKKYILALHFQLNILLYVLVFTSQPKLAKIISIN